MFDPGPERRSGTRADRSSVHQHRPRGVRRETPSRKLTGLATVVPQPIGPALDPTERGHVHPIGVDDILVVSPHNMQVNSACGLDCPEGAHGGHRSIDF